MTNNDTYNNIFFLAQQSHATLVAVSKTKHIADIQALYNLGQKDFGENYVQELVNKKKELPQDIRWHFIGHLQSNKVKEIACFIHLIHTVDSYKLLKEIDKQAQKANRIIDCLLQISIAEEETKFGMNELELKELINTIQTSPLLHVRIVGLMGMATFTTDESKIRQEFQLLKKTFDTYRNVQAKNYALHILSMGMSSDYAIALEEGSTMLRIGSLLFGKRD